MTYTKLEELAALIGDHAKDKADTWLENTHDKRGWFTDKLMPGEELDEDSLLDIIDGSELSEKIREQYQKQLDGKSFDRPWQADALELSALHAIAKCIAERHATPRQIYRAAQSQAYRSKTAAGYQMGQLNAARDSQPQ